MKPNESKRPSPEPELIRRAQGGDRQAMADLYEATSQEIYRTVHAMIRNEDLTLDIQQDTYVTAFSHLDQLREPESFLPWLRQIAVNQARAQLRKKTPALFTDLEPEPGVELPELADQRPEISPELALDRKENSRLIREILGTLSDSQRMLVGMYYYEEMPVDQIAKTLEISPGTVKTQLSRSRKKVETQVRALEAQGVKLYGLGPMAYVVALLRQAEPAREAGDQVLAGTLTRVAAKTAGVRVASGFLHTALGRASVALLAAAVVGTGIWGYGAYRRYRQNHPDREEPSVTEKTEKNERLDLLELNPDFEESMENLIPTPPVDPVPPVIPNPPVDPTQPVLPPRETETAELPETPENLETTQPTEATNPPEPSITNEPPVVTETPKVSETTPLPDQAAPPATTPIVPAASQPANPGPVPTVPPVEEVTVPPETATSVETTESQPPATTEPQQTEFLRSFWTNDDSEENLVFPGKAPNTKGLLCVMTRGDEIPTVYADGGDMLQINFCGNNPTGTAPGEDHVYYWNVQVNNYGTATIYCQLNGSTRILDTISIERPEAKVVSYRWDTVGENGSQSVENPTTVTLQVGRSGNVLVTFQGLKKEEVQRSLLQADNPNVSIGSEGTGQSEDGIAGGYWGVLSGLEAGESFNISCILNGVTQFTFRVEMVP